MGKKKEKFRITLGLAANADGSEKMPFFTLVGKKSQDALEIRHPKSVDFTIRTTRKHG